MWDWEYLCFIVLAVYRLNNIKDFYIANAILRTIFIGINIDFFSYEFTSR